MTFRKAKTHICPDPDCIAMDVRMCPFTIEPYKPVYKITIGEETADAMFNTHFTHDLDVELELARISPIVFYARLTDEQAVDYAQRKNFQVVRAREDWSI